MPQGDEDEEADGLVDQIFEEIGLGLGEEVRSAPPS